MTNENRHKFEPTAHTKESPTISPYSYLFFEIGVFLQLDALVDASLSCVRVVGAECAVSVIFEAIFSFLQQVALGLGSGLLENRSASAREIKQFASSFKR